MRWLGSLDAPHSMSYFEDMGRAYVILGERAEADGQIWHLPAAEPITGRRFLEMIFAELRMPPMIGAVSPGLVRLAGAFVPMIRELGELMYQWTAPFALDVD